MGQCRKNRSEEHTSELQSQSNLVCRLLLEKNKTRARGRLGGAALTLDIRTHRPPPPRGRPDARWEGLRPPPHRYRPPRWCFFFFYGPGAPGSPPPSPTQPPPH